MYKRLGMQRSYTVTYDDRRYSPLLSNPKFSLPLSSTDSIFITSFQTTLIEMYFYQQLTFVPKVHKIWWANLKVFKDNSLEEACNGKTNIW